MFIEGETIEFKEQYIPEIRKEIIAFANTNGGTIYIGVSDDGGIVGVDQPDEVSLQVSNSVRDSIKPDLTMFIHYETLTMENKSVIGIRVGRGTARPYYLGSKGLRPEGVYVRQGSSSVPASEAAIRQMIKETDGDNYEDLRSMEQSLTFHFATDFFARYHVEFGTQQMKSLGMIALDGIYTNLGLLLSDQCPHIIKAATFGGQDQQTFQDRREFGGSLLKQLEDAYSYLEMRNQTSATFDGLFRIDAKDYPESALREALLNAIVHREYAFSASTLISVYTDRIEIVSAGGLVHGISIEDVLMGLSVCRNAKLANVFYRLNLIEAYGTGMEKIKKAYEENTAKPTILSTANAFKVVLPKMVKGQDKASARHSTGKASQASYYAVSKADILRIASEQGAITRKDIEEQLRISTATAIRILKELVTDGSLIVQGGGRSTRYLPK